MDQPGISRRSLDFHFLISWLGILRISEFVLSCVCFSLVASVGPINDPYWVLCMFTWCLCCFITLAIVILQFTALNAFVPVSWEDFTTAFSMLATLLLLATSVIYPTIFIRPTSSERITASVLSWICLVLYAAEIWVVRRKPGESNGFILSVSGILKILEIFLACIIFSTLISINKSSPELKWCVAVFSLCFIFTLIVLILSIGRLRSAIPFSSDTMVTIYNILAAVMYLTAVIIWPLYSFNNNPRPDVCKNCMWDKQLVVSFMTAINFIVYVIDAVYAVKLVFFTLQL